MKRALIAAAVLFAAPALAQEPEQKTPEPKTIEPGYWESVHRVSWPVPYRKVERRCIQPADVAKFLLGPSNHIYKCVYPVRQIGNGTIRLEGSCATKRGKPVPLTGSGTYTATTLKMQVRIVPELGGLDIPVHASTDAHRIGDVCPTPPKTGG